MTTRDYSSEGTIKIAACERGDIMDDFRKEKGYFHIAAVQILVKWLGNSGIDIPLQIAIRDERLSDPKQSILGLWSSNLYSGAVYTELFTDLFFSAAEKNIDQILTIQAKPTVERLEGSKALAVSVNTYMSWIDVPHPFRKRDAEFNKGSLQRGKSVIIKSSNMDVSAIPQPIPVEGLTYDLDFDFERKRPPLKIGEANEVDYMLKTKKGISLRLKQPVESSIGSTSRRYKEDLHSIYDSKSDDD